MTQELKKEKNELRYRGKIDNLNHIIISDPSYDDTVTCRYERKNIKEEKWSVDIEINEIFEPIEDFTIKGVEFFLFLTKGKNFGELIDKGTINYLKDVRVDKTEIGMDSACVAIGINEKAKEIVDIRNEWQPECALKTLTDGLFGMVTEGKLNNELKFICLSDFLDEDTEYSIEDVIDYLQYQLNISELEKVNSEEIEDEL